MALNFGEILLYYIRKGIEGMSAKNKKREMTEEQEWFVEHAWLFFDNKERILADDRLANIPIEMSNCLAYTGSDAFKVATMRTYLEWWSTDLGCRTDEDGMPYLVVRIAGSPLSGANKCLIVKRNGEQSEVWLNRWPSTWHTFQNLCQKHRESANYDYTFTLGQLIIMLKTPEFLHLDFSRSWR